MSSLHHVFPTWGLRLAVGPVQQSRSARAETTGTLLPVGPFSQEFATVTNTDWTEPQTDMEGTHLKCIGQTVMEPDWINPCEITLLSPLETGKKPLQIQQKKTWGLSNCRCGAERSTEEWVMLQQKNTRWRRVYIRSPVWQGPCHTLEFWQGENMNDGTNKIENFSRKLLFDKLITKKVDLKWKKGWQVILIDCSGGRGSLWIINCTSLSMGQMLIPCCEVLFTTKTKWHWLCSWLNFDF